MAGERRHAEALIAETEQVIAPLGLTLSREKTSIAHIDEGIEFLGWSIKRQPGRDGRPQIYTYPSKPSLQAVMGKVKQITPDRPKPDARPAASPAQPGAARLVRLLPTRCQLADLQLPARLHMAAGDRSGCDTSTTDGTGAGSDAATYPAGGRPQKRSASTTPAG